MIPSVNSVLKNKNSLRQFGSVIWSSLPIEIREDHSIVSFLNNKTMETNCLSMCRVVTDPGKSGKHCFSQKVLENLGKLE